MRKIKKLETAFIRQCAPTLAGLKSASLFRFKFAPGQNAYVQAAVIKEQISSKGLRLEILAYRLWDNSALIFVYRPSRLESLLEAPDHQQFFREKGYEDTKDLNHLLHQLSLRINMGQEFPHEIGLLLGYPLADVQAYIEAPKEKGLCTGCWKAYSNPQEALAYYQKCAKCTEVYWQCYQKGFTLQKLAVAC